MRPDQNLSICLVCCLSAALLCLGCSKKEMEEVAAKAAEKASAVTESVAETVSETGKEIVAETKKAADAMVEQVEEVLPQAGKIVLNGAQGVETSRAEIQLHSVGDGRPNSLQITSYSAGAESIAPPAVFLYALTDLETVALAGGQTLAFDIFVELGANGVIARNQVGQKVDVTFDGINVQENTIAATIAPFTLVGSDNSSIQYAGGEVVAVVSGN